MSPGFAKPVVGSHRGAGQQVVLDNDNRRRFLDQEPVLSPTTPLHDRIDRRGEKRQK